MVADGDSGAELPILDKQLLSGEAADTHTHTHGERACWNSNFGYTTTDNGTDELGRKPWQQRNAVHKANGGHGEVALYESGAECLEIWTSAYQSDATDNGDGLHGLLAVALPNRPERLESSPFEKTQPKSGRIRREFNPDPRVADWENGEALLDEWVNEFN